MTDDFDFWTVFASAGVSAGVAWVTAKAVVVRQERAKQSEAAMREIRDATSEAIRYVGDQVRYGSVSRKRADSDDDDEPAVRIDLLYLPMLARVLEAADSLRWLRRWRVRFRLLRIYGKTLMEHAELHPANADSGGGSWSALARGQLLERRRGRSMYDPHALILAIQRDLVAAGQVEGGNQAKLLKHLKRLRRGRKELG